MHLLLSHRVPRDDLRKGLRHLLWQAPLYLHQQSAVLL
jgi:hypothetical protein